MATNTVAKARLALPASAILVLLCIAQFLEGMDVSSMGVTLPIIQKELGMNAQSLQWIVSGYVLGFGGFLLLGGRVSDLFGRRRVFLLSMLVFALASLVAGIAGNGELIIAARIVKGICAGFAAPAALALLLGLYRNPAERNRALGVFATTGAVGFASGLVIGGVLADISWRLTALMPMVVALAVVAVGALSLSHDKPVRSGKKQFDLVGAVMITSALLAVVLGATQAATYGWLSPLSLAPLAAGVALFAAFLGYERRIKEPLIPPDIFSRPGLGFGSLMAFFLVGNYMSFQFAATLYYQQELGWSALQAGLAFLIGGACVVFGATRFAKLALRIGPVPVIVAGMAIQLPGYIAWLLLLGHVDGVILVLTQQILGGIGFAAAYPAINIKALAETREDEHGLASGIILSAFQIGGGIILAVVASVFAASNPEGLSKYSNAVVVVSILSLASTLLATYGWQRKRKDDASKALAAEVLQQD